MIKTKRPRVVAIGLDDRQVASIAPLCGELREAYSLGEYLLGYNLTETDVVVSGEVGGSEVYMSVHVMAIGKTFFHWPDSRPSRGSGLPPSRGEGLATHYVRTGPMNTERELVVPPSCPDLYKPLAAELSRQLSQLSEPPAIVNTSYRDKVALIETTSGFPVALRLVGLVRSKVADGEPSQRIALVLPEGSNLAAWFRAFLHELHEVDPIRVPQAPPRLSQPSDWYTPEERFLADRKSHIESEIERLSNQRDQLETELAAEGERADSGNRQALWADGDELTAVVRVMLDELGFTVRDMDAELRQDEPKREDLRLTREGTPGWQAMVEVKGYTSGTKTNDARQIRENRDRYILEEGRFPDLTVWLSNPYRKREPSSRPVPNQNVKDAAEKIGTVHVLASDLYRQWALVAAGNLDSETVFESLANADPGLWTPPAPVSDA